MRFIENGPNIPEELLIARDEGRVVFFCGAGVSRHRVKLPDFVTLTKKTMKELGLDEDSPAHHILKLMELDQAPDDGCKEVLKAAQDAVTADRIFSILEREFFTADIEQTVSKILTPHEEPDLVSHQAVIDLSRTPDGRTQLITTNFDRLFEACDPTLKVIIPPLLPNPELSTAIDGVIHLHGVVNENYTDSEGAEGFILSTGSYGKAYLSEAWATEFIKAIFQKYIVVFLGYSADDPPIHFLLEALNKQHGSLKNVFAFSSENMDYRWLDRGVQTIGYNHRNLLWETIEQWSLRAKNPEGWFQKIAEIAHKEPEHLNQFKRGQIAHLVSETTGAKVFSELSPTPSAEWLNVFDQNSRYATPFKQRSMLDASEEAKVVDPFFDLYGIDSDEVPEIISLEGYEDYFTKREVPAAAWNAFSANEGKHSISENKEFHYSFFNNYGNTLPLPRRLSFLANWLAKISNQPACINWVVKKPSLHSEAKQKIERNITDKSITVPKAVATAWQYVFEAWESKSKHSNDQEFYQLKNSFNKFGATSQLIRKYCDLRKSSIEVSKPYSPWLRDNDDSTEIKLSQLVRVDIEYYRPYELLEIPDELYSLYVREMRLVLEYAIHVENELGSYRINSLPTLFPISDDNY